MLRISVLAMSCMIIACGSNPQGITPPPVYYENPDSTWKVIWNLRSAYQNLDLEHYIGCFRDDFEFHFVSDPPLWDYWGLDVEEAFHEAMFEATEIDSIRLSIEISYEVESTSIPNGIECGCPFSLQVYADSGDGYWASGQAVFTLLEDSTGVWQIVMWFDYSDYKTPEAMTWAEIKQIW